MSEIAIENKEKADKPQAVTPPVQPNPAISGKKSTGETIFDRTVYTGIGFGVNEISSMIIADELRYGKNKYFGKHLFQSASESWMKLWKLENKTLKNGKVLSALSRAQNTLEVGALLIGGTLLVVPMWFLEHNKGYWVKKGNHLMDKIGSDNLTAEEIRQRDEAVEKTIACQPKQSWGTLLSGRAVAIVTNMGILSNTLLSAPVADATKKYSQKYVTAAFEKTNQLTGGGENSAIKRIMNGERFPRYARILGLETAYTLSSSVVLEISSKFFARKKPLVHNEKICEKAKQEEAAALITEESAEPKFTRNIASRAATHRHVNRTNEPLSHVQKIALETDQSQMQPGLQ